MNYSKRPIYYRPRYALPYSPGVPFEGPRYWTWPQINPQRLIPRTPQVRKPTTRGYRTPRLRYGSSGR